MSSLQRLSVLSLRDRLRSSVIQQTLLYNERSQLRWLSYLIGGRACLSAWEHESVSQEELEELAEEREVWVSLLRLQPT